MIRPGDVISARFIGVKMAKYRPTVVVSTAVYQAHHPEVIVAELTSKVVRAVSPTDYILLDWAAANLHQPSAFRVFLNTVPAGHVKPIGHLSDRDWQEVQARLRTALAVT
jgi:mRNA-degrading endonuclease toxin of MazEF toxin-antitoxin module